ncbi:MAG: hypothetical protein H6813_07295 [Phycisphaeraceae bacterium]|nr:hypothetical protein [Phycisphaeraceae bacterium]
MFALGILGVSVAQAETFNANLIENPSFEQFMPLPGGPVVLEGGLKVDLNAWIETGSFSMDLYGAMFWNDYPAPLGGGDWVLIGDFNAGDPSMEQTVDISFASAEIDAGVAMCSLEAWMGSITPSGGDSGSIDQDDIAHIAAHFLDAAQIEIGALQIDGPSDPTTAISPVIEGTFSEFVSAGAPVPIGARSARIVITLERDPDGSPTAFNHANVDLVGFSVRLSPFVVDFENGTHGWSVITLFGMQPCGQQGEGVTEMLDLQGEGGVPGSYLSYTELTQNEDIPFFCAGGDPRDIADAFGGFIRYERRIDAVSNPVASTPTWDVALQGLINGEMTTLFGDSVGRPTTRWLTSRIPLIPDNWRVNACDGPHATESELIEVLSNLAEIRINAEYRNGDETNDIDNVIFLPPSSAPQSTFDFDTEGWGIINDAVLSWQDTPGANPQCLYAEDLHLGDAYFFEAPSSFLGDQSAAFGKTVELDFLSNTPLANTLPDGGAGAFIHLVGGGMTINYLLPLGTGAAGGDYPIAGNLWRYHAIPLTPCPAWTHAGTGDPVTESEFMTILTSLSSFWIRGETENGPEFGRLDNVVFGSDAPSIAISAQGAVTSLACAGDPIALDACTGGYTPIALSWAIESPPDSYNYIEIDAAGFTDPATGLTADVQGLGTPNVAMIINDLGAHPGTVRLRAIASNAYGSSTSASVEVSVTQLHGDLNNDNTVDTADLGALLGQFGSSGPDADLNNDGVVDTADLGLLLTDFGSACP